MREVTRLGVIAPAMREIGIRHGLQIEKRHNRAAHRIRTAQGKRALQIWTPGFYFTSPNQGTAGHGPSAEQSRYLLRMGGQAQVNVPFQVEWRFGHEVSPAFKEPANVSLRRQSFGEHHGGKGMEFQFEFCCHSEVRSEERRVGKECRSRWPP